MIDSDGQTPVSVQFNAFIHKSKGQWIIEPQIIGIHNYQFKGDFRDFGEDGTSRVKVFIGFDSSNFSGSADVKAGISTRRSFWPYGTPESKPAIVSQPNANYLFGYCPNKCWGMGYGYIRAAYPFYPAIAPTEAELTVQFRPLSAKAISLTWKVMMSPFPDYELIIRAAGKRIELKTFPSTLGNISLMASSFLRRYSSGSTIIPATVCSCCLK